MRRSSHGAALAALTLALASGVPSAFAVGEPIMPLAEVQPGMKCFGSTVVSGVDPVTFDATVISVEGGPKPTDATIAMRYSGAVVENSGGIASGYSGSPVRCPRADGSFGIIGAVAYGIGQYDNLVGLVTPIEAMLGMPVSADAPSAPVIGVAAPSTAAAKTKTTAKSKKARAAATKPSSTTKPVATPAPLSSPATSLHTELPITLTGPKGALAAKFVKAAAKGGKTMLVAPAATRSQAVANPILRPGDAVAATSVFGDVTAGAIGTVTYVDGDKVYAFGHPNDGTGPARLQMERARISTVISSPTIGEQASYKLGSPIGPVGTISFDGAYGVAGTLGAAPASIRVSATVRDAGGTVLQDIGANVVDERPIRGGETTTLLPLAAAATAGTALQKATNQVAVAGAARACTTITLKAPEKPLEQCVDTVIPVATSQGGVESGIAEAVASAVLPVTTAERFLGLVERVAVDVRFRREADSAEIVKISAPSRPKAGSTATVKVTVTQGTSGEQRIIPVKLRIPRYAAGETTGIVVIADAIEAVAPVDEGSLSDLFVDEDEPLVPKNLKALRALYTPAGISGLRAVVVPGFTGSAIKGGLLGDEDSELDDTDLADVAKHTKLVWELPSVETTGIASATVVPR